MTVSTQVSRNEYTGNGATTQYDFTFRILDKSHLLVQTMDTSENIVTLTLGTDYTVTGVNRYNGGKVVLTSALPAGYKISIERSTPVTQEASIRNQGGFFPEIHEDALDKLTMLVQQAYGWWSGLSLRKPSWLANYYDALNNRIRNLRDPSQAQDAATKNYVDSADSNLQQQITGNFNRSLRVPEASISPLPSAQDRAWMSLGFDGSGSPKLQDPAGTGLWGYVPAVGSFEQGSLLTQRFEVLLWESTDEYWRWDGVMPKVVLPGSTPDTAGGRGKGKWLDVTDATLRSNLISDDGLKLIGKCATIAALRTVEPSYEGQSITLRHAVSGGHEINCSLWYDADDVTTDDDGYSVFVTSGGARWKADVSRGLDIRLAGLLSDNSNLGTVLNAVITGEVNKIKAAGTIKGAITNIFIPASRKVYTIDTPVFIPSFMCMNTNGYVYMLYPSTTGSAFSINNAALDIASGGMPSNPADVQGCKIFNAEGGRFILSGPGGDVSTGTGLYVGDPNVSVFAVRDLMACDLTIFGFKYGIQITARNNFINTFYGIISMLNQYGVYVSGGQALNAGEKMIFEKCTIGNNSVAHFWFQAPMWYHINNCSLDYTSADVFLVGNLSQVSRILIQGGHVEGVPGYLVNCPAAPGIPVKVQFRDTQLYMNGAHNSMRQLIHAPGGGCAVSFEECDWTFTEYFENSQYISLSGYNDGTEANNRCVITNKNPRVTGLRSSQILPRYNNGLMGWRFNFVGAEGASILNLTDANTKITVSSANTDVIAKYGAATSDGARTIEITAAAATDVVELLLTPYYPAKSRPAWCGGASVNIEGVTAGECDMYLVARTYEEPTLSFNSGTSTITTNRAVVANYISDVINISEVFSHSGTALTSSDFVGVWQSVSQAQYADSCRLALRFTNFVGTVKVKLPVFWQAPVL
ncbi:TPA: hypothetical protein MCW73_001434 [Klebsiella pneumoniae]|uniref:phage tail fiber domain-containing protein n=13 Tax=Klebsiella pneumoniae TaxID=573 RepID=UPI0013043B57|nr:phage tail fiber protein [Klebsiella pneumoniae]HBT7661917.1 hypothetical protein [Klebsiella pneumoniae]HBT7870293.1 hypothetical protein [Klebsiella pneumoniae]HBU1980033.1 hypothetical protein [Klebsiella pneumoniae]HBU2040970.1 hypothetical protein [Klebsiella pneumoniae]HBU2632916.1 hypothetical protein [Klebsiella pneumoniae]